MSVYERLEAAGHDVTLVHGLTAGVSTYACERCGAVLLLRNDEVILFHVPQALALSSEGRCHPGVPPASGHELLRDKLNRLHAEDMERFRQAMED